MSHLEAMNGHGGRRCKLNSANHSQPTSTGGLCCNAFEDSTEARSALSLAKWVSSVGMAAPCVMLLYCVLCLVVKAGVRGVADQRITMAKMLTDAQVTHFREQGWLAPFRALSEAQAADCAAQIAAYETRMGESANRSLKIKGHLAMPFLVEVARSPAILDSLEDLIGPDILLFGASIFAKSGKDRAYVSWHQDSAYFGLDPHEEVTAWVAFTHSNAENGALQVLPRTHLGPDRVHEETYAPDNMLARGQSLNIEDDSGAVTLELQPGEFSLHHERTAHGSKPNHSASSRIGFAFFYIPTHVRSTTGRRTATLVRGSDRYRHWDPDPLPKFDFDPVALAAMRSAWGQYRDGEVRQAAEA